MRGANAKSLARKVPLTYKVAWTWCHKLRQAMKGEPMRVWPEALAMFDERPPSVRDLHFHGMLELKASRPPGSEGGCPGCRRLDKRDWQDPLDGRPWPAGEAVPDLDTAAALARDWMLGSHRGAMSEKHLGTYLVEHAYRFNRRLDRTLAPCERLLDLMAQTKPHPYRVITGKPPTRARLRLTSQHVVRRRGQLVLIGRAGRPPLPTPFELAEELARDRTRAMVERQRGDTVGTRTP